MATAVTHGALEIPGMVLRGVQYALPRLQQRTVKFWAVVGESRINGFQGGRDITIPLLLYDSSAPTFDQPEKLQTYIDTTLYNQQGIEATLSIVSANNRPDLERCIFENFVQSPIGILRDEAKALGGNYFVEGQLVFRQLRNG